MASVLSDFAGRFGKTQWFDDTESAAFGATSTLQRRPLLSVGVSPVRFESTPCQTPIRHRMFQKNVMIVSTLRMHVSLVSAMQLY
jgi:hypothetical protein